MAGPQSSTRVEDGLQRRAQAVMELSLSLAELVQEPPALHHDAVRRVAVLVGDASLCWLRDRDGAIVLSALSHPRTEVEARMRELTAGIVHAEDGFLARVWEAPGVVRVEPGMLEGLLPSMGPAYRSYFSERGLVGMLLVPLRVRGVVLGVLGVSRDQGEPYSDEDEVLLRQVSAVVAVAVDNARLLEDVHLELAARGRAEAQAQYAARHDALTGLPNRRMLVERLDSALAQDSGVVGLLVIDLDRFKHVNDTYGHAVGDAALVEVGRRLVGALPASGSVPMLARLGGDEFAVLLPSIDGVEDAERVAQALVAALDPPVTLLGLQLVMGASVGIALAALPSARTTQLLRYADIAMYRAKRDATGWAVYSPDLDRRAAVRLREVKELRDALEARSELVLAYQPLVRVDLAGQRYCRHVEALVRWQHPTRGLLLPAEFLPLVEDAGLFPDLTTHVLETALDQVATWWQEDLPVQVAVNVPASALTEAGLPERLRQGLRARGLPAKAIALEVTESDVLVVAGGAVLEALLADGVDVALDDFGTGYSSLSRLADVPASTLKLDRTFLGELTTSDRHRYVVASLVRCAHAMGLTVVAEGVETAVEEQVVLSLGVDLLQGYLYSRPVPAEQVRRWFSA